MLKGSFKKFGFYWTEMIGGTGPYRSGNQMHKNFGKEYFDQMAEREKISVSCPDLNGGAPTFWEEDFSKMIVMFSQCPGESILYMAQKFANFERRRPTTGHGNFFHLEGP